MRGCLGQAPVQEGAPSLANESSEVFLVILLLLLIAI